MLFHGMRQIKPTVKTPSTACTAGKFPADLGSFLGPKVGELCGQNKC